MLCFQYKVPRIMVVGIFMLFLVFGLSAEEKFAIAVMDFKITNVKKDEVDLLIDYFNHSLFQTGIFDVIQRDKRNRLLKEIEFSSSDVADQKKTREIGKLLSAKLLVFGSVGKLGSHIIFNISVLDVETGSTVSTYSKTYDKLENIVDDLGKISNNIANAAMQTMFIKKAQVIYYDDFSAKNWIVSDQLFYKDGKYNIYNKKSEWFAWATTTVDDFALEIETQWIEGADNGGYGVIFRLQDEKNYYLFSLAKIGYFRIEKMVNGKYQEMVPWERSSAVNNDGVNYIKVKAVGKQLTFYVNNIQVKELFDSTFTKGNFGMLAGAGVHAAFDNLVVYQGNLLLYTDFSKVNNIFFQTDHAAYKNGEYVVNSGKNDYYSWTEDSFENISFAADVRWVSGATESGYGLALRVKDVDNHYLFIITKSGYFRFGYYKSGKWNTLIDWTNSRYINPQGKNVLRAECVGSTFKLYINDNPVGESEDSNFAKGKEGLFCGAGVIAAFDNAQVFKLDQ
ncbi:MAG: CsgG/HfaB family protein [Spirochaetia bacterium]